MHNKYVCTACKYGTKLCFVVLYIGSRNFIKKCRLLILLTYKYPILFCKMVYRFGYFFLKNEITKSFFEIHFLIKLRSA